jgi:hypothetical protein
MIVDKVFGTLSRFSDPSEEVILGYKAFEGNLPVIQNLDAAARRLGLNKEEMLVEPYAFVDRSGWYKAPFRTAVKVAKHYCRRFPREVLGRIRRMRTSSARNWSLRTSSLRIRGGSTVFAAASTPKSV